jgi:soluble lytic murein transglycosylase-like protein
MKGVLLSLIASAAAFGTTAMAQAATQPAAPAQGSTTFISDLHKALDSATAAQRPASQPSSAAPAPRPVAATPPVTTPPVTPPPVAAAPVPSVLIAAPSLPIRILTDQQRAGYAAVFAAIRASNWIDAAAGLDGLGDGPLHAIARAELYLAKGSPKVALESLQALLARAPEIPEAAQLARLAATRGASTELVLPQTQRLVWQGAQPRRTRTPATRKDQLGADFENQLQPLIRDNQAAAAEALLIQQQWLLAPEVLTEYQQRIGWSYYTIGDDQSARRLADLARVGTGDWALSGEWLAGLAAWRMRDCASAETNFATVAGRTNDPELAAAGHYWASRADMMCGHPEWVQTRLRNAARYSETFYGLLAQSALGILTGASQLHNFHDAEWRRIADRPNVKAAIALTEIGERDLADEVIKFQARLNPADHAALIHLACDLNLPTTQIWLSHYAPQGSRVNMAAHYPTPSWSPVRGWRVDPSLVFAHALQESGFRTNAVSTAGAVGLMQVRPGSASDIARSRGEAFDARQLTDPAANIEYGQTYLEYLRDLSATGGLLPKVIAAYNAGPLPVSDWNLREFDRGDPLLYIESIPYWETRSYVPVVLRNYWVYEQANGRPRSTSRDALVQGLWPRFPGMAGATAVRITAGSYASQTTGSPQASGSR